MEGDLTSPVTLREIREKSQKKTHFSWNMSLISHGRFFENSKSTDVMADGKWNAICQ